MVKTKMKTLKIVIKIRHQFQSICMNSSEQNKAKRLFLLNDAAFSELIPPTAAF